LEIDGEASIPEINSELRKKIAAYLGIRNTQYRPSSALSQLWR
jgi:hypothetical protein